MTIRLLITFLTFFLFYACEKEEPVIEVSNPFSIIQDLEFDESSCAIILKASLQGFVLGDEPTKYGFVYSYDQWEPTIEDFVSPITESFENRKSFSSMISDFKYEQDLYVRVFAQYRDQTYYGSEVKTINPSIDFSQLQTNLPLIENCGSDDIMMSFKIKDCFPSNFEYGLEYKNHDGPFVSEIFKVKKGVLVDYPTTVLSNLVQEADERNAFSVYVKDPNSNIQYNTDSYLIPNSEKSTSIERLTDFPGPLRAESVSFTINGKGYVCGGYTEDRAEVLDDLWEYTPETDTWAQKANIPGGGKALMTSFTTKNFAYVGVGGNALGNSVAGSKTFFRYDPSQDSWQQIADYPNSGLAALSFSINDVGYVGGMLFDNGAIGNQFFKYEEEQDQWVEIASFPGNFFSARNTAISSDNKGYLLLSNPAQSNYFEYDPEENNWSRLDIDIKFDGNDGVAFEKNGKIYQFTGRRAIVGLELDFISLQYSVLCTDASIIRSEAVGFNLSGSFYIVTGIEENNIADIAENLIPSVYKIDVD